MGERRAVTPAEETLRRDVAEIRQALLGINGQDGLIRRFAELEKQLDESSKTYDALKTDVAKLRVALFGEDLRTGILGDISDIRSRLRTLAFTIVGGLAVALIVAWVRSK